jgi:hypothetical protein
MASAGEEPLHHLTDVSSATGLFSTEQLHELLAKARVANERDGITGMLLYKDGNFMQTIEGPAAAIDALRQRIELDPRHHGIIFLRSGSRSDRLFDGWSMGFTDLTQGAMGDVPGYSEFLRTPFTAEVFGSDPDASQRLLLVFRDNMR